MQRPNVVHLPSIYTPEGSFTYLLLAVVGALAAAVAYRQLFTSASFPP